MDQLLLGRMLALLPTTSSASGGLGRNFAKTESLNSELVRFKIIIIISILTNLRVKYKIDIKIILRELLSLRR